VRETDGIGCGRDVDEAELPEIRRQTPVSDGIQTSPNAPARLADGLEVEGPPRAWSGRICPWRVLLARPRVPPLRAQRREFGSFEHTPRGRASQKGRVRHK